jgi:serine/threonine protein kinase
MQSLEPGSLIAGKYRIERVLGEGGMGTVFLATHLQLGERVAIKVPLAQTLGNRDGVARFMREARAAVRIKSEYVARVIDVGELGPGAPYMVMEYLEGQDLATRLAQQGALPVKQAVEFVLQACEALAEAHALGIVHRDLKPANLFCVRRPDGLLAVKVLDFGISKAQKSEGRETLDESITKAGELIGSPLYMSPEQIVSARDVDARTDIWAIGVILFELLCDRAPFHAENIVGLGIEIANSRPLSPRVHRAEIPAGLEQVIRRCMEKDRERRYQNVSELSVALMEFGPRRARASVARVSRVIRAARLSAPPVAAPDTASRPSAGSLRPYGSTSSTFGHSGRPARSRAQPILLTAASALLLGAIGTAWFWSRQLPAIADQPLKSGAAPVVSPPLLTVVAPRTSGAPPVVASAQPAVASAVPRARTVRPGREAPSTRPRAPKSEPSATEAAHPPPPDCFPKFYFDSRGTKHFKAECL